MTFINREKELAFFDSLKKHNEKKLVVLYGRRRIGKTTLMKKVMENEPGVFYYFIEVQREETLLRDWSLRISKGVYQNWYDLFSALFSKYIFVILDEFQHLWQIYPGIYSSLQHAWDDCTRPCMLIVLGSYVGMMKRLFQDEKLPLFGRNDHMINLQPFPLKDALEFLRKSGYSLEESLEVFFLVGGIPKYLLGFQEYAPLKQKLYALFLDTFSPFREETKNLLIQEFGSAHRSYASLLGAIAGGRRSLSEIQSLSGIPATSIPKYLLELEQEYAMVHRSSSILPKKQREQKYQIADPLYHFHFHFLDQFRSEFAFDSSAAYERAFPLLSNIFGIRWEEVCMQWMREHPDDLPFTPTSMGRSWGSIPGRKGESFEIDVIAMDEAHILFGECKWTQKKMGIHDLDRLREKASRLSFHQEKKRFVLFSKTGFHPELEKLQSDSILLLAPGSMF